jgi:ech hydrogenase subunit A
MVAFMGIITFLILMPFAAAAVIALMRTPSKARDVLVFLFSGLIIAGVLYFSVSTLMQGGAQSYLVETPLQNNIILLGEFILMVLVFYFGFRYKKYYVPLLSAIGTLPILWLELSGHGVEGKPHLYIDQLTVIMALVVGIVGSLICIYAVGYLRDYHKHHTDCKDRTAFFIAIMFVFLGAMFGLIFSANLAWMYFFWEITTLCSFLLISYPLSELAIHNAFRALWMTLLGGCGFMAAIVYSALVLKVANLEDLAAMGPTGAMVIVPVTLLAFAALTKSAQLPFSKWLLGAMVAPTPSSALLHSATMVKAGVYLLIRLSPALAGNAAGIMVTTIGGFTFFATSLLAISQSDGKKVLAYSTISNLGLITACAGVGAHEAAWAAVLLLIFHAVSKSLMFLTVGAVENSTGSRNIEDMHGLIVRIPQLAYPMIVGICGMFLAPFGMLISKWAALKSFIDSGNFLLVLFVVFGSATTTFYWAKWLGKLIAIVHQEKKHPDTVKTSEKASIYTLTGLVILLVVAFPVISAGLVQPYLANVFHDSVSAVISSGDLSIMLLMLLTLIILPLMVRILTLGKKGQMSLSYMAGANVGDDRKFVDSLGNTRDQYLANWYMEDYFGEKKLWKPSVILAAADVIVLLSIVIGGALK